MKSEESMFSGNRNFGDHKPIIFGRYNLVSDGAKNIPDTYDN